MEILNIIETNQGIHVSTESFVFSTDLEKKDKKAFDSLVKQAENVFLMKAKEHGFSSDADEDIEILLDYGTFGNMKGYEICLSWSDKITTSPE